MFIVFLISLCLFLCCSTLEVSEGSCKNESVSVSKSFDITSYLGLWYEIRRYDNLFQMGDCKTVSLSLYNNNTTVSMIEKVKDIKNNETSKTENYIYFKEAGTGEATIKVVYNATNTIYEPYWVVDTDYTGYAIIWSCDDLQNSLKVEYLWIFSRQRTLNEKQEAKIKQVLEENVIGRGKFYVVKQNAIDCI